MRRNTLKVVEALCTNLVKTLPREYLPMVPRTLEYCAEFKCQENESNDPRQGNYRRFMLTNGRDLVKGVQHREFRQANSGYEQQFSTVERLGHVSFC
jgi:hypothetical protein